jgi:hypothetical protein
LLAGFACALLAGCNPAAEQQRAEEAVNRGEAMPATKTPETFESACARVGGSWSVDKQTCGVTQALCAAIGSGNWSEGSGCVVDVGEEAECSGFSGIQWTGSACVLASIDSSELSQAGLNQE